MVTARDLMHRGAQCVREGDTLAEAARMMRDLQVGALPVCGDDNRLRGIITDRDLVIHCIAEGRDPATMTARELAQGPLVWVDADADADQVLRTMEEHRIRRVPVIEQHDLVGMISEADVATHLPEARVAEFVGRIAAAPPTG
ncbi:MAG: CBS domain-containing protein [Actinomycetota bacterium]